MKLSYKPPGAPAPTKTAADWEWEANCHGFVNGVDWCKDPATWSPAMASRAADIRSGAWDQRLRDGVPEWSDEQLDAPEVPSTKPRESTLASNDAPAPDPDREPASNDAPVAPATPPSEPVKPVPSGKASASDLTTGRRMPVGDDPFESGLAAVRYENVNMGRRPDPRDARKPEASD